MAIKKDYGSGVTLINNKKDFQTTYEEMATKMGLSLDPDDPRHFYNWRALYKETGKLEPDETGHFPSKYKLEGHPRTVVEGVNTITGEKATTSRQNAILGLMKQGVIDPDTILNYLNYDQQGNKVGDFTSEEIKELQPKTTKVSDDIISKAEELTGLKLKDRNISYSLIEMDKQIKGTPLGQQNKNVIVINSSDIDTPAGETSESSLIHELMHTIVSQNALDKDMSYEEREAIIKDSEYYYLAGGKGVAPKFTAYEPEKPVSEPLISEKGEQTFDYGSGVKLLKPKPPPTAGVSQRMRGIGEPPKKYPFEGITVELSEANKNLSSLWWSELKTTEDKGKFLKHENWSPELQEADLEVMRLSEQASKMGVNTGDWIEYGVYMTFFAGMAASILPIIKGLPAEALNKVKYKVGDKTVKGKELFNTIRRVAYADSPAYPDPSKLDKEVFAKFIEKGGVKGIGGLAKGITIPTVEPRFAFGTKLYAGLPADEIVKSIVEVGKVTADMVKGLDPTKVSQVTQQLLNTSPALASEFLKAVEKPEIVAISAKTAISRTTISTTVRKAEENKLIGGRVLHQGAGRLDNPDRKKLDELSEIAVHYDPNFSPETKGSLNKSDFNTVVTPFVVNVLPPTERNEVYKTAAKSISPDGNVIISARGSDDILRNVKPTWEKFEDGYLVPKRGFQRGYTPEQLKVEAEQYFSNVQIIADNKTAPIILAKNPKFIPKPEDISATTTDYTMPPEISFTGKGVEDVGTEPIPEGGTPPATVSKKNTIFNSIAKKVQDIESKIIKTFDIEAPFNKIGAQETGFQVKNYFNNIGVAHEQGLNEIRKLNKLNVKPVTTKEPELKASGQLDYTDITYLSERPGYFVKLTPEERKIASSAKKAVKDFYKGWEKKLTEIGWLEEPFPQSYITRANNRIYGLRKQLKDVKKPEEKTVITNEIKVLQDKIERIKKQKIQFVSVPVKTIFSNAEDNPEVYNKIMSILPKWDRETITVKDLVEVGVLTRKEADIRYIIGEYSDRMGKKYALGKIFETAAKEGLIKPQALAPNWPSARVYVNGRYVDIPQLRGKRLEPFFSDTVTDFFSKGQVMASPIFGTIKMMQFYNPLMMPMYDVWQSAAIGTFLNPVKGAMHIFNGIKDTVKKTDNYWAAYENGIFSKPFSIPYDKFKIQFERAMKGNKLSTFLKEATLPTNWLRMLYSASWHTAWKLDETIRMISFNYLKDKGLTDRRAAQLAALFHSDYASVPPATRRTLNKILFTPTFKITMSKLYLAMLKGGAKTGAKGFKADASSKILGRGALLALATMFGIKLFFESQGYEEEEVFRKYVKSIETDEGIKENVITLSHPFNIPWRYYYRVKNAWKPQNLNKIEALVDAAKWDLHPIWRVAYDIAKNENFRIYNPFDEEGNIVLDVALYTFGEFVAISKGILESAETGEIKAENFRLLQKDMGRLRAIIIKPFIFNYARTPESRKVRSYIEGLRKEFDYLMRVDPSKDPKVNYQRVENFKNRISEIRKIIDKEVPSKGDIKIKYGSGVEILEKDYGAGVKILK